MTKREMIEAMLAGKMLETEDGYQAYFSSIDNEPFRFWDEELSIDQPLIKGWSFDWHVKPEPRTRPMTRMERLGVLTREGCVVRDSDRHSWELPNKNYIEIYGEILPQWAIIDKQGNIIEGPHKFEVTE